MVKNIKFSYFYRDSCNYKNYDCLIFENPSNIEVSELEQLIKAKLIQETWFYTQKWQLPDLSFPECNYEVDPTWHEFE